MDGQREAHIHHSTTDISPDLGELAQSLDDVNAITMPQHYD
jgi:hypothetical protein